MATIYTDFFKKEANSKISATDQAVYDYVFSATNQDFEKILQEEGRFPVYLALSELRRGLFNWYDFCKNARILEVGGGYGALTGLFCEKAAQVVVTERSLFRAQIIEKRYESVENLSIYVGDIMDMPFEEGFDYIILTGILERTGKGTFDKTVYAEYLKKLGRYLKSDGILLAAVDNRYGLRYFAGMKNIHTGKVFDSIRKYPEGNRGAHSFTRKEIEQIWDQAGYKNKKIYYPLPDYRLPQLIYTDKYLPEKNLRERLIPYYPDHVSMLFNENMLYDDLVENEVFPFFANSFLIESTYDGMLGKAVYAAVSTDRGKERSFATVIYEDEKVAKIPLYQEGERNIMKLYERMEDIAAHGLNIVPQSVDGTEIIMPRIYAPMLSNVMKEKIVQNSEEMKEIVERLWQNILRSSEEVNASENVLVTEDTKNLPWGPILKKVYMELIPLNCFYQNEEFIYFDQEFVRENYPAKYALFRAIHYIYCFTERASEYIPLSYFQERYKMKELWPIFQREENRFLDDVRKREAHKAFYKWAYPDKAKMQKNVDRLNSATPQVKVYQLEAKKTNPEKNVLSGEKPYKIGYVPGVFDLFHVGHLNLIRRSKQRCEHLIVGVLTDELVEHFKHKRPHISYEQRAAVVAAIREVDEVVAVDFHNTKKIDAWNLYHFDCHFSGNDHGPDWKRDLEQLLAVGSNMEFFEYTQGVSSTQIKQQLAESKS